MSFYLLSSIFYLLSSIFYLLSSIFYLLSSICSGPQKLDSNFQTRYSPERGFHRCNITRALNSGLKLRCFCIGGIPFLDCIWFENYCPVFGVHYRAFQEHDDLLESARSQTQFIGRNRNARFAPAGTKSRWIPLGKGPTERIENLSSSNIFRVVNPQSHKSNRLRRLDLWDTPDMWEAKMY